MYIKKESMKEELLSLLKRSSEEYLKNTSPMLWRWKKQ